MKRITIILGLTSIIWILISNHSCLARERTRGAAFLKLGVGGRPAAMGEAFCAIANDATASYWNPAGLTQLEEGEFSAMYTWWFQDISHHFLGYARPFGKKDAFGFNLIGLKVAGIEEREGDTEEPLGEFSTGSYAGILSYGRRINRDFSLGSNLKYISERIKNKDAGSLALDIAVLYRPHAIDKFSLGLNIRNIALKKLTFAEEKEKLPFNVKFGTAYKMLDDNLTLAIDLNLPSDDNLSYHLGTEYWIRKIIALRAGYNSCIPGNKLGKFNFGEGLSAGFGINIKTTRFDVAYVPYGDLGNTYRVSLLTRFGETDGGQRIEERIMVTDDGDYIRDKTRLYASWSEIPRAVEYQYAIGTSPGEKNIIPWTSADLKTEVEVAGLDLVDGKTYYFSVKAKNKAGLWSLPKSSDGIMVDITSPSTPLVIDDGEITTDTTSLHFRWFSQDPESGIIDYKCAISTSPKGADVVDWTSCGDKTEIEVTGLDLSVGKDYYLSVKARNGAGLWSDVGISDGITIDKVEVQEVIEEKMPPPPLTLPLPEIAPTTPDEVPKYEELNFFGEENFRVAAQVYEDPEHVKLYVHLKNVGNKTIYPLFRNFTLETREGNRYTPDLRKTIEADNSFFTIGGISPNSKAEGFIIFNTKDSPDILIYKDLFGNKVSINLP